MSFDSFKSSDQPIAEHDQKSLPALIENQYGMSIIPLDVASDLETIGYQKLSNDLFPRYSSILQQIPGLLAVNASTAAYNGAFIVSIPNGLGDCAKLLQKKNGFLSGTIVSSNTGKIIGQADLTPIDMITAAVPNIALAAFSIASIATGQYFMARMDKRLSGIEGTVNGVQQFLEVGKKSELRARQQFLIEIHRNMESIIACDILRQATLTNVQQLRQKALSDIFFYHVQMENVQGKLSVRDSRKESSDTLDRIVANLPEYWSAVHLYGLSALAELLLSQNSENSYLENVQQELNRQYSDYKNYYNLCTKKMIEYISTARGFQINAFPYTAASILGASLSLLASPAAAVITGSKIILKSKSIFEKEDKISRAKSQAEFLDKVSIYKDIFLMEEISDNISLLDEMYHGSVALAYKNNDIYIKLPDKT